jgi:hypothetical protein
MIIRFSPLKNSLLPLLIVVAILTGCQEKKPWQEGLYFLNGEDGEVLGSLIYTAGKTFPDKQLPADLKGELLSNLPYLYGNVYIPEPENHSRILGSCTFAHPLNNISYSADALSRKTKDMVFNMEMGNKTRIHLRLLFEPGKVRDISNAFFSLYRDDSLEAYYYYGSAEKPLGTDTFRVLSDHLEIAAVLGKEFGIGEEAGRRLGPFVLLNADIPSLVNLWNGTTIPGTTQPMKSSLLDSLIGHSFSYQDMTFTFLKAEADDSGAGFRVPSEQYYVRLEDPDGPGARLRLAFESDDRRYIIFTQNRFGNLQSGLEPLEPSIIIPFDSLAEFAD